MIDVDIEQQLGAFHLAVRFAAEAPIVGLFGRSGAGKTSVINAIAGIAKPARGHIRINDVSLFDAAKGIDLPPDQRRIGYVFQDALLFPHMDVESNLLYGRRLRSLGRIASSRKRASSSFWAWVRCCSESPGRFRAERSNGWPSAAPCSRNRASCSWTSLWRRSTIPARPRSSTTSNACAMNSAIPIVYVSHSVAEISRLADTVVVLSDGKCIAVGDVDEVMGRLDLRPATGRYEAGSLIETQSGGA